MTKLHKNGVIVRCPHCGAEGDISGFSEYAQTSTPLVRCCYTTVPMIVVSGADKIPEDQLFQLTKYPSGRDVYAAWKDFPRA